MENSERNLTSDLGLIIDELNVNDLEIKLSASSYKQYLSCPRSFLFHKIIKPAPTHPEYHWGWFGSMIHNSIYYSMANLNEQGEWIPTYGLKPLEEVLDFYNLYWKKEFDKNEQLNILKNFEKLDEEEFEFFARGNVEIEKRSNYELGIQLIEAGMRLIRKLYSFGIEDLEIEKVIHSKIYDFDIVGYIDLQFFHKGKKYFLDFKTSRVPLKEELLHEDLQFFLYSYMLKNTNNLDYYPNGYLIHLRSATAFGYNMRYTNVEAMLNKIKMLETGILNKEFLQNFSPLCRYCKYRGYCNIK
ncbi:MAG: PD-(D/E)XK nuclease family protein [Thermoproteota archaeon]